ncbi:double zinc ribbon and ankyrin repeat-containing protein 1-like isoform X2 [Ruditapes philippinarum]|uniref:double zinc ribbon and ankyrin repeat-containing protein 1-like isoform X2 n=1 Tax=Ruditapes philippinarum TaxID=129788 RepID=UPI00295AFF4D|nr:double zinc ribbon and ankyrin repeat-containing protein 1-like isoform X2 [Ruditapes philippinarum]
MTAGSIAVPTIFPLRPPIPGKPKSSIDSNTKIELSTESNGARIYYTINGTKPDPFPKVGQAKYTMEYQGPFTLPAGKQTLKAMAVGADGIRESNVVTKVFEVDYVAQPAMPPEDDDLEFRDDLEKEKTMLNVKRAQKNLMMSSRSAWTDVSTARNMTNRMADMDVKGSNYRQPGTGTRFLNTRQDRSPDRSYPLSNRTERTSSPSRHRHLPDNTTQAMRLQRETDFLKCVYCFADRPSDPYARFCNTCGNSVAAIPQTRIPPPEPGQMGTCVYCKTLVPFNTSTCVVCEGPIPNQNQPQASIRLAEKVVCTLCGTGNPANLSQCITCDTKLPTSAQMRPAYIGQSAPPITGLDKKYLKCTKCNRVNRGEARFCDWCGAKPAVTATALTCSKCRANNHPYATFCGSCGVKIDAPYRVDELNGFHREAQWLPVSTPLGAPPKPSNTIATQTVGLFYPSTRGMEKEKEKEEDKLAYERQMRDRRPLLTAVSPGKGYWRKQVEHICQHVKAHAQNDAEFRALIGEPKMGKLLTSTVQEDGYELSLTVTFALRGGKDKFAGKKLGITGDYLSFHTEQDNMTTYRTDSDDYDEIIEESPKKGGKKIIKKKRPVKRVSKQDQLLLKEIGPSGEGDPTEVQQLIDEGSDPNCVNKNNIPALHIAAKNKWADCISVLVKSGADVDKKGPSTIKGNTALHEAVNVGPSNARVVEELLSNGADQNMKNDKGESPYDLAVKGGYENIVKKFAAALGQSQLDKMIRPKSKAY